MNTSNETASLLRESIAASNRTTRAVRAFVRFIFIQFFTGLAVAVLWSLAAAYEEGGLMVVAFLVALGGLIWASIVGFEELAKSDPDSSLVQTDYSLDSPRLGSGGSKSAEKLLQERLTALRETTSELDADDIGAQK